MRAAGRVVPSSLRRGALISNVFADANVGGAAITLATVAVAKAVVDSEPVFAVLVRGDPQPRRSLPFTLDRHPDLRVLDPPFTVASGPVSGAIAVLRSVAALVAPGRTTGALDQVERTRLVLGKGGWVFVGRRGVGGLMSLWLTAFPLVYARRVGTPTAVFPTSIGPFPDRRSRWLNRMILRRADLVFARDGRSYREALALGLHPDRVIETPDGVFAMEPPDERSVAEQAERFGVERDSFAVVTVRDPRGFGRSARSPQLLDAVHRAARAVLEQHLVDRIVIVVHAGEDRGRSAELAALIGDSATLIADPVAPDELCALYGAARLTVACRLHSAIFSLVAGTPALAVSIDGLKTEGVYESLGLPSGWVVDYATFGPDDLAVAAETMCRESANLSGLAGGAAARARARLSVVEERLAALIDR